MSAGAFDSRSGRLASIEPVGCFGLASISIDGKRHLPAWTLHVGRCRVFVSSVLEVSMA